MNKLLTVIVALCLLSLQACNTLDIYEKSHPFSMHEWKNSDKPSFTFHIEDTVSAYNIYVVVRHEDAYRYNNMWLNVTTQAPSDTARTQMIDITLANNAKGWLGTGMDDVFDHRIRITRSPVKLRKGNYTFMLQHAMREDPLQYVLSAGIRVEKANP